MVLMPERKFQNITELKASRYYSGQVKGPILAALVRFWVVFGRLGGVKEEMPSGEAWGQSVVIAALLFS